MKRRALLDHLQEHGCVLLREGGSHSSSANPRTACNEAIPRHTEIKKYLARSICRNLSVPFPPGN